MIEIHVFLFIKNLRFLNLVYMTDWPSRNQKNSEMISHIRHAFSIRWHSFVGSPIAVGLCPPAQFVKKHGNNSISFDSNDCCQRQHRQQVARMFGVHLKSSFTGVMDVARRLLKTKLKTPFYHKIIYCSKFDQTAILLFLH